MITDEELLLCREALQYSLDNGADAARITLTKSTENIIATLDGAPDRVTRCGDRSMNIALFADGRFGSFSINKLDSDTLRRFILDAIGTVRLLAPDPFRRLPSPERCCRSASGGRETGIFDPSWSEVKPDERVARALGAAWWGRAPEGVRLISEEGEYSDSEYDTFLVDSQGLECRHTETSFDYGVEVTVQDADGNKYSDYWWTASPFQASFDPSECGLKAIRRACAQIGSAPAPGGRFRMVVGSEVASRLVTPLLNALNAYSIQQGNSFLAGTLGSAVFHKGLTIFDEPFRPGESGSKLFDSEGVACANAPVIEGGVIKRYSVNTYMAGKMGIAPTVEDVLRARLAPWPEPGLDRAALMKMCCSGILVTDFNGGNCNMATGDFSYGISGQLFENGTPVRPVSEMLITGNFLELWKGLVAAGEDYRTCDSKLIPSLAFEAVDFSG